MYVCRWHFPGFFATKGVNWCIESKADWRLSLQLAQTITGGYAYAIYPDSCSRPKYGLALETPVGLELSRRTRSAQLMRKSPTGWCLSNLLSTARARKVSMRCFMQQSLATHWLVRYRGAYPILGCILVEGMIDLYWTNRDESWWIHFQSACHWPAVDAFMPCRSRSRVQRRQWQRSFWRSDGSTPHKNSCKSTPLRTPILHGLPFAFFLMRNSFVVRCGFVWIKVMFSGGD